MDIDCLLLILEKPAAKKGYIELKKYYDSKEMKEQSEAIQYLIDKRYEKPIADV